MKSLWGLFHLWRRRLGMLKAKDMPLGFEIRVSKALLQRAFYSVYMRASGFVVLE